VLGGSAASGDGTLVFTTRDAAKNAKSGNMLREAQGFLALSLYPVLVPGFAIIMTVLGWSLLGDGLRDMCDPRSR